MTIHTISPYASTFHEDPTKGNNLPLEQAVAYNEWKRSKNLRPFDITDNRIKSVSQMYTTSQGLTNQRRRRTIVQGDCVRCRPAVRSGKYVVNNILPVRGKGVI